jgi:CHRD domain-containing protein
MSRLVLSLTAGVLGALIVATLALGAARSQTFGVKAVLDVRQEVPREVVKVPLARGTFSGTLTTTGASGKIAWRLTFTHLSGPALQANIQLGKLGRIGPIAIVLCAPCHSGMRGKAHATARVVRAIKNGAAYVNVRTRKNQNGEIRGQIRLIQGM